MRKGKLIAYPTDSCYALGCQLGAGDALDRLRRLRGFDERHRLTLMCRDIAEIANFAVVDDTAFRFLKVAGSYTFILRAGRHVPRRATSRKNVGVRIPGHPVAHALLEELGEPMLSATLQLPGEAAPLSDGKEVLEKLKHQVDLVIDAGSCGIEPSTVIDLTGAVPRVLRQGKGPLAPFDVERV